MNHATRSENSYFWTSYIILLGVFRELQVILNFQGRCRVCSPHTTTSPPRDIASHILVMLMSPLVVSLLSSELRKGVLAIHEIKNK